MTYQQIKDICRAAQSCIDLGEYDEADRLLQKALAGGASVQDIKANIAPRALKTMQEYMRNRATL